jgi:glycosyltransferase involved in cell wall biosynthesis
MKRVLHIIDHLGLGGAQAVLLDLVTLLDRTQWDCEVAVMHGRGLFAEALEAEGIKVHELSPSPWLPIYVPNFIRLQRDFDVLHFHLSGANWIAKPLAAIVGEQPRIAHDHASDQLHFRGIGSMLVDAAMHRFSSHTIAVAPAGKKFLTEYGALSPESVTVIPNGIKTELFRPFSLEEKKEARAFFQLPEEAFIIGTAGRLAPEKNQKMFLEAAHQAIQKGLRATFVIAGAGPEESALRHLAARLEISNSVRFLGQVQERVLLYRALDLFALPSRYEGLPIVLLEAMASGVPVVCTDLEGIHYALEGGLHGGLVPSDDVEALAKVFLDHDHAARKKMAESARRKVEEDFSSSRAAAAVGALYRQLL